MVKGSIRMGRGLPQTHCGALDKLLSQFDLCSLNCTWPVGSDTRMRRNDLSKWRASEQLPGPASTSCLWESWSHRSAFFRSMGKECVLGCGLVGQPLPCCSGADLRVSEHVWVLTSGLCVCSHACVWVCMNVYTHCAVFPGHGRGWVSTLWALL